MPRALLPILALAACTLHGDGERGEIEREVPWFDALEVFGDFEIDVQIRPELGDSDVIVVRLTGDANALDRLFTVVHGEGTLTIAVDPSLLTELTLTPTATLEVPALTSVFAADRARVRLTGSGDALSVEATEEAAISARDLAGCTVTAAASTRGNVTLAGDGPFADLDAEGQALIDASAFRAEASSVHVDGDATVKLCSLTAPELSGPTGQITNACAE